MAPYFDEEELTTPLLGRNHPQAIESPPVYPVIHQIREDIIHYIDNPLSYEALMAPDLAYTLVRPLTDKYINLQNMAVPFCLLLNRAHFLRDSNIATRSLSQSRAELCEIMAIRAIRHWADSTMDLATVLTTSWLIFSGAESEVFAKIEESGDDTLDRDQRLGNAIEMAITSQSKRFIKSSACQKVINAIWSGKIVYTPENEHAILSDTYKRAPIHFYDPMKAPLLDHYRLKVPAVRSVLEYLSFAVLFLLFILVLETNEIDHVNIPEWIFIIYALGFTFDRLASMQEHGIKIYSSNLWNGFDLAFILTYVAYVTLRLYGAKRQKPWASELGVDILALEACFMFPRLAFVTLSSNLMVLSLRSMIVQFARLMALAIFCFGGFLYALWTFGKTKYPASQIAWWMADLWFGLDASGFDKASTFHPVFGPPLMAVYACLSNTLLVTVLVSILSYTFSQISEDAAAESMFRHAVSTIEGVKADALFSYQPPLNLLAFLIMWPASFILTPRWFHKVNVMMIRITAFPILLAIGFYERQTQGGPKKMAERVSGVFDKLPRKLRPLTIFDGLAGVDNDIDAVFEIEAQLLDDELTAFQKPESDKLPERKRTRDRLESSHSTTALEESGFSNPPSKTTSPKSQIALMLSPPMIPARASTTPPLGTNATIQFPDVDSLSKPPSHAPTPSSHSGVFMSDDGHDSGSSLPPSRDDTHLPQPRVPRSSLQSYRSPPVPLPPRHVRTRRDSAIAKGAVLNPSISAILEMSGIHQAPPSPLGQLFGNVVKDHDEQHGDEGVAMDGGHMGAAMMRRRRTMSVTGLDASRMAGTMQAQHRRRASNISGHATRPDMFASARIPSSGSGVNENGGTVADSPQPETVQELEDEEEDEGMEARKKAKGKASESSEVMRILQEMGDRQTKIEKQLEVLVAALQKV